ncbi:hypothetical protein GCM10027075_00800 [Streptomyces heilongjiangensis]
MVVPPGWSAALVGGAWGNYPREGPAQLKGCSELAGPGALSVRT